MNQITGLYNPNNRLFAETKIIKNLIDDAACLYPFSNTINEEKF